MDDTKRELFLPYAKLQCLITALQQQGFTCVGPQVRDGVIVYEELLHVDQLPWGLRDHQGPGEYRLEKLTEKKAFGFSNGPQAIKPILFRPLETIWKVTRNADGKLQFQPQRSIGKPVAIIGARACDLAAMVIQDKVFMEGGKQNSQYKQRRDALFVVAVNCTYASSNCFCVSAGTGPAIKHSFDILLTEIDDGFELKAGSVRGEGLIKPLALALASESQTTMAINNVATAAAMQTKQIPLNNTRGLRDLLFANLEHPRWDSIAERCLSCGNCTSVCPTCFCHSEVEKPSLDGGSSEHQREWGSCFTSEHSYLNGKIIRDDTRKRYRQWLTHKVGSWFDQFDTSGCVGCGRCIAWCPVGIDITEELAAISGQSTVREKDDN